jgi:hypothetical protein
VAEVLSSLNQGSFDVVASLSHDGSGADTSGSDGDNWSNNSSDELTESYSDSTKKVMVAAAVATAGMTFNFGSSTIGKDQFQMMEGLRYFAKVSTRAPSSESVPEPWVDEAMVFEDLFATELRMPPHPTLVDIL